METREQQAHWLLATSNYIKWYVTRCCIFWTLSKNNTINNNNNNSITYSCVFAWIFFFSTPPLAFSSHSVCLSIHCNCGLWRCSRNYCLTKKYFYSFFVVVEQMTSCAYYEYVYVYARVLIAQPESQLKRKAKTMKETDGHCQTNVASSP